MASTKIITGQVTLTGGADQLTATATAVHSVAIKALDGDVYVGDSTVTTANGFKIAQGETVSFDFLDLQRLHVRGTAAQKVCFLATGA